MPTLETAEGQKVDVTPVDAAAINAQFNAAMSDDGPDEQAPPKRQPRAQSEEPKPRRGRPPKSEQARTTAKPAVVLDDAQRAQGVAGVAQLGAAALAMAARSAKSQALLADSLTVANHADALADACVQVARQDQRFAAVIDKICSTGPYGALITVAVSMGSQIFRNHRPAIALPGTIHPDDMLRSLDGQASPAAA